MSRIDSFMNLSPLKTTVLRKVISFSDISAVTEFYTRKEKQRQAARTPNVVFVVASHYQSLQIVVLLLQVFSVVWRFHAHCCCNSCSGYNRTGGSTLQLLFENRQCCKLLEGKVEMFSQFRSCWKDSLATFLYSKFCGLGLNLHCSYWPFIKVM